VESRESQFKMALTQRVSGKNPIQKKSFRNSEETLGTLKQSQPRMKTKKPSLSKVQRKMGQSHTQGFEIGREIKEVIKEKPRKGKKPQ